MSQSTVFTLNEVTVGSPSAPGKLKLYTRGYLALPPQTVAPGIHHYHNLSPLCSSEHAEDQIVCPCLLLRKYTSTLCTVEIRLNAYTGRRLSHTLPLFAAIVWMTAKWRKNMSVAWVCICTGKWGPCNNSFFWHMAFFYCLGKLIIDLRRKDLKGLQHDSAENNTGRH